MHFAQVPLIFSRACSTQPRPEKVEWPSPKKVWLQTNTRHEVQLGKWMFRSCRTQSHLTKIKRTNINQHICQWIYHRWRERLKILPLHRSGEGLRTKSAKFWKTGIDCDSFCSGSVENNSSGLFKFSKVGIIKPSMPSQILIVT